ncbi:TlpA family protein disulfide reductase [Streptomyces sp. NBC_00237]|uniref:TlpA family protein disulfide reductase n=1 Tax=Streptomyces sp. NBC_00237 TaxID=2975687 RepID=UPI0022590AF5|nr:TlpA disulfide reductase family protein [Streptomyces sp. NBC_00237]MCX5205014.1 TlpA family protein disulfide reductase [Streptomyces sp. NBC_00237]
MSPARAPRRRSTRTSRTALAVSAVVAGALALSACSGEGNAPSGGGGTNFVAGKGGIDTVPVADRTPAPTIDGKTLQGEDLDLASYKGKVVVMNIWGSWCPPCRAEAPTFAKVAKELKGKGVEFVGIDARDPQKDQAIAFEKDAGIEYPSLYDPDGKLMLRFPKGSLNPQGIPNTLVIDKEGRVAGRSLAALSEKKLRQMIDPVLAEK